jgi:hypothetical protein
MQNGLREVSRLWMVICGSPHRQEASILKSELRSILTVLPAFVTVDLEVFSASLPVRALVVELSNLARGIPDHGSFGANMLLASPSLVFAAPQPFAPGLPGVRI